MKPLVAISAVALLMLTLLSPAYLSIPSAAATGNASTPTATSFGDVYGSGSSNQAAFYLSSGQSNSYNESWNFSASPVNTLPASQTSVGMKSPNGRTGYFLFMPGVPNSGFSGQTMPQPSATSQYGWISTNPLNETIPAGNWNMSISINVNQPQTPVGTVNLGVAVYSWNSTSQQFAEIMSMTNQSFNIAGASNGTHVVNLSDNLSPVTFLADHYLFAEFYLSVTSFASFTTSSVTLNIGNTGTASDYIKYPYFGWLNGTVSPSSANITLNGISLTLDGNGAYSVTLPPGNYAINASAPGYAPYSGTGSVSAGRTTDLALSLSYIESISFVENGLPASTNWSVTFNGTTTTTNGTLIVFHEIAGSYNYTIGSVGGFKSNISQGMISLGPANRTVNVTFASTATGGGLIPTPTGSKGLLFILVLLILLIVSSSLAVTFYVKTRRMANGHFSPKTVKGGGPKSDSATKTAEPEAAAVIGATATQVKSEKETETDTAQDTSPGWGKVQAEEMLELGSTFAFFEEKAEKSILLFEAGLKRGLKGLCFTREFPEKLTQKHDLKDATVIWISNVWAENSIRPNNLEKINLLSEECLATAPSVIFVDGLESLITNNGFLSVIKMLGFLRDAAAVHHSVLVVSVNRRVITEGEIGLLKREVDRVVE